RQQLAKMSTEAFEDFYFDVCNLDYSKMSKAMDSLVDLMNRTDKVHLTGKGTDLTFSIKDIPAVKCAGEMNIPDGEVYTAPVRDSVNGTIAY
ncbi:aminopeptidase, partial [Escherichia coli]|nr:aminopeptidase [Escherichia coli]